MKYPINTVEFNNSLDYFNELLLLQAEAELFLNGQKWCDEILNGWLFINYGYILNIYVFEISNNQSKEDNFIWVIVGDFPPMYLDTFYVKNTVEVLETYIDLGEDWLEAYSSNSISEKNYPFNISKKQEDVTLFQKKILGLRNTFLPQIDNINIEVVKP